VTSRADEPKKLPMGYKQPDLIMLNYYNHSQQCMHGKAMWMMLQEGQEGCMRELLVNHKDLGIHL